jgi:tetratricopeptide (TPR) repeat protein
LTDEEARKLIDSFALESPEAYRLALAASLAVRVEAELVRALRFYLFPNSDPGSEADLWFSPLVQSQTPQAIEFEPEVQELLRRDLAGDEELLAGAWCVLECFHSGAPYALRLEEELTWLGLSGAKNEAIIERRLQSVIAALRAGQRVGLAQWASRALPSLPEKARDTEAAKRLSVVAGLQTGVGPVLAAAPGTGVDEEWLSEFTAKKFEPVKVGVRLLKNEFVHPDGDAGTGAETDAMSETPMLVEFSLPPAPESEPLVVPDTYRLLIEVSWETSDGPRLRQLSLLPGETRPVGVGYGEVTIRTALGDTHTLRPHFEYDLLILYQPNAEWWARRLIARIERERWNDEPLKIVASPAPVLTSREAEELKTLFGASRKVGLVISDIFAVDMFAGEGALPSLTPSRPEPRGHRDWLLQLNAVEIAPILDEAGSIINFGGTPEKLEEGFRALWKAVTGADLPLTETTPKPSAPRDTDRVSIFISYAHKDQKLRDELLTYLTPLVSEGLIESLDDRRLSPGTDWRAEIDSSLQSAQIILLLVSPDYLASDYVYDVEMKLIMERHEAGAARVIPVILRPCEWQITPFAKLQVLPKGARPVTEWRRRADAFKDIVEELRTYVERVRRVTRPTLIPRPPAFGFVARRDEQGRDIVERLRQELAPGRHQLVTLSGPGGSGKTTLGAEAARSLREAYEGRVVWSSADGRPDFSLLSLLDDIATQLERADLRTLAPAEKEEQVRALVADALIVLDNYERVAEAEQGRIEAWFKRTQCSTLFTSRTRVPETVFVPISAMPREEAAELLEKLTAQSQDPQIFTSVVRERVYEASAANPFVMQWVVGQIDLAGEPDAVLEELSRGEGAAAERVFDRSFELPLLGDDGRDALLALSLFAPSARPDALAEAAGFDDEERLSEAVRKLSRLWLIKGVDGNQRLSVEGLTRTLAAARLSKEPRAEEFRRRFVAYFLRYAAEHREAVPEAYDALEAEKDNLLGAVGGAFASQDWGSVMQMAFALARPTDGMLVVRGYWDEAVRLGEQALQAARSSRDEANTAALSLNLAVMYTNRGEPDGARRLYDESLEIYKRLDRKDALAITLHQLGGLMQETGDFEQARRLYYESLEINRKIGHQAGVAIVLYRLGALSQEMGDREQARRFYNESLEINKRFDDQASIAATLNQLGRLAYETADAEEARRLYGESLEIRKRRGDQFGIAETLQGLGILTGEAGGGAEARSLLEESLTIYKRLGSKKGVGEALHRLGQLAGRAGDTAEALRLEREALDIFERLQSPDAQVVRDALAALEGRASGAGATEAQTPFDAP